MRMLFTSSPGVGHLLPIMPVAMAARAAGHDVLVGCGASVAPIVERAGLRHAAVGQATIDEVRPRIAGLAEAEDGQARAALMFRDAFGRLIANAIADDVLALGTDWRPAVLVHEDMEMGGWIAVERLGIPHVTIQAAAWRPERRATVIESLNEIRVRIGLAADPDLRGRDGVIWFTTRPRSLRDPAVPMSDVLGELRPDPDDRLGHDPGVLPDWLSGQPTRPRIAVTLGTVNANRTDLFRPIIAGLAGLDVDVVVALGAEPDTLGPVPGNVRVERYVPMSLLLPRSSVVVHHAGSGTTLSALAAGRPSVLVPITADQPINAAACERAGAGITIDATALTADNVRLATQELLLDPRFAGRAAAIATEIAAMPDAGAAVSEIEARI